MTRKLLFEVALARAEWNKTEFARFHHIAPPTLQDVLNNTKKSERINKAVDAFCEKWVGILKADLLALEESAEVI